MDTQKLLKTIEKIVNTTEELVKHCAWQQDRISDLQKIISLQQEGDQHLSNAVKHLLSAVDHVAKQLDLLDERLAAVEDRQDVYEGKTVN